MKKHGMGEHSAHHGNDVVLSMLGFVENSIFTHKKAIFPSQSI